MQCRLHCRIRGSTSSHSASSFCESKNLAETSFFENEVREKERSQIQKRREGRKWGRKEGAFEKGVSEMRDRAILWQTARNASPPPSLSLI